MMVRKGRHIFFLNHKALAANNGSGGCQNVNGSYVCPTNIDKYNPMEREKTNLRDFNLFCSTHGSSELHRQLVLKELTKPL
jgi:hypothetical protein